MSYITYNENVLCLFYSLLILILNKDVEYCELCGVL